MAGLPAFMVFRVLRLQQQARHAILVIVRQVDAVTLPPHSGVENPSLDLREPPLYPNVHVTAGHHGARPAPLATWKKFGKSVGVARRIGLTNLPMNTGV